MDGLAVQECELEKLRILGVGVLEVKEKGGRNPSKVNGKRGSR
jgi:hypothetical protein